VAVQRAVLWGSSVQRRADKLAVRQVEQRVDLTDVRWVEPWALWTAALWGVKMVVLTAGKWDFCLVETMASPQVASKAGMKACAMAANLAVLWVFDWAGMMVSILVGWKVGLKVYTEVALMAVKSEV
jgi:hypothetical protein